MTDGVVGALRAFGHFWWDFLIGDTPELALATGIIVGVAFLLAGSRLAGAIVLPLLAAAFLLASTLHAAVVAPPATERSRARVTPGGPERARACVRAATRVRPPRSTRRRRTSPDW